MPSKFYIVVTELVQGGPEPFFCHDESGSPKAAEMLAANIPGPSHQGWVGQIASLVIHLGRHVCGAKFDKFVFIV